MNGRTQLAFTTESRFQVSPLLYSGAVFWSCIFCDVAGGAWRIACTLFYGAPNPANQCVFFLELGVYGNSALAHIIDHRAELPHLLAGAGQKELVDDDFGAKEGKKYSKIQQKIERLLASYFFVYFAVFGNRRNSRVASSPNTASEYSSGIQQT